MLESRQLRFVLLLSNVSSARSVRFGIFEVDLHAGELRKTGIRLKLGGQPFQVLAILLERPGDVFTREELQKRLWPDTFVDVDHNLNTAVNKIREVLGDSSESPRFVETLPRRGYRFIAPVESTRTATAEPQPQTTPSRFPRVVALVVALLIGMSLLAYRAWHATSANPQRALTRLTFDPGLQIGATWSPDSRYIAFSSFRSGKSEIWDNRDTQTIVISAIPVSVRISFPPKYTKSRNTGSNSIEWRLPSNARQTRVSSLCLSAIQLTNALLSDEVLPIVCFCQLRPRQVHRIDLRFGLLPFKLEQAGWTLYVIQRRFRATPGNFHTEEKSMKYKILYGCAIFAFVVSMTPAQMKLTSSGKCGKPYVQHDIEAGDQIGHLFTLAAGKCATKGEVGGAASKEGLFSEYGEVSGDHSKVSGVFVETFDSGDKIFYTYQATGTMKDRAFQAGENKYQITGGTGKMKGIKGSGTCKTTGTADGGLEYTCTGEYTIAGAAAAK